MFSLIAFIIQTTYSAGTVLVIKLFLMGKKMFWPTNTGLTNRCLECNSFPSAELTIYSCTICLQRLYNTMQCNYKSFFLDLASLTNEITMLSCSIKNQRPRYGGTYPKRTDTSAINIISYTKQPVSLLNIRCILHISLQSVRIFSCGILNGGKEKKKKILLFEKVTGLRIKPRTTQVQNRSPTMTTTICVAKYKPLYHVH